MEIVKHLKDYTKTTQDEIFEEFLSEHLESITCYEKIKNPEFILESVKPVTDFLIYTNASPEVEARRLASGR